MAHLDWKKLSKGKDLTPEQQALVDTMKGEQSVRSFVRARGKGKTVNDLVKMVLHQPNTDCPVKETKKDGTVEYYSLSHLTSKKDGKLSAEGKAFYAWVQLSDEERANAPDTFYCVLVARSMKANMTQQFEFNKDKHFRFKKTGEPITRIPSGKSSGTDAEPTRKVDDIYKAIQTAFDIDRANLKPAELAIVRTSHLRVLDALTIDKNLPEVTGI